MQFWKYAVTGCSLNTELMVWSCESWTCLQTITFNRVGEDIKLKAALDPTARDLVLADIDKCLVFILSVEQGVEGGAIVVSVTEFAPLQPSCPLVVRVLARGWSSRLQKGWRSAWRRT